MTTAPPMQTLSRDGSGRIIIESDQGLTLDLREEDGNTAIQCDQGHCAFAEAAKRQMPGLVQVIIGRRFTRFCFPEHVIRYQNSHAMRLQIKSFDDTGTFDQGVYKLLPVAPTNRLGARPDRSSDVSKPGRSVPHTQKERTMSGRPAAWSFAEVKPKRKSRAKAKVA